MQSEQAQALGIVFWADVKLLLEFDPKDIAYLSSFSECVDFYSKYFYKLDTAIRNLYTEFLNKRELLEPFQEYYKGRARKESDELRALLERQRGAIKDALDTLRQVTLPEIGDKAQQRQVELDIGHLTDRTHRIGAELESEPAAIEALYAVRMSRRTPLGLVVAWPEAMT
jgi:hypothetical protein